MDQKQNLLIDDETKSLVTFEHVPVPEALFPFTSKEVILSNAKLAYRPHSSCDSWNIAEQDVANNVVPPAFSEMRQDVLPGELHNLVKDLPEVQNEGVSEYK